MGFDGEKRSIWKPVVAIVLLTALILAAGYWMTHRGRTEAPAPGYFEDVTAGSGIDFTYRNGEEAGHNTILESLGGGVALLDYDGDGLLDIFVTGGGEFAGPDKKDIRGRPGKLYKNLGGFKFKDVTAEVGLDQLAGGQPWFYSHGCAVADYDNDGWPDLLVTGWGRIALFHNEPDGRGGRKFVDVSAAMGLAKGVYWATSAGFGDFDGDGWPDLYVCQYVNWSWTNHPECKIPRDRLKNDVCPPEKFLGLPHLLFHNNGGKNFTLISDEAGLRWARPAAAYEKLTHLSPEAREYLRRADREQRFGKGLGVLLVDLDDDGKLDICVANDTGGNLLYLNKGGGRFEELGVDRGFAYNEDGNGPGSMGIDAADYDGSGHFSVFVANADLQMQGLYRNLGKARFVLASHAAGLNVISRQYVGFGAGFIDFDLDGNEGLFISNGHVLHHPPPPGETKQRPVLMRNERKPGDPAGQGHFADVTDQGGPYFREPHMGRGAAFGDFDNRGRTDIVLNQMNEPVVILKNRREIGHHWLGVELIGAKYRDAVGAKLELDVGDRKLVRQIKGGGSYMSANDRRMIFGLGNNTQIGKLTVRWPSGKVKVWENLAIDRYWKLNEE